MFIHADQQNSEWLKGTVSIVLTDIYLKRTKHTVNIGYSLLLMIKYINLRSIRGITS